MRVVALAAALVFIAIVVAAFVDHAHKHHERAAARRDAWFCAHRGTHCDGADPIAIEDAWNRRERVYIGVAIVALAVSVGAAAKRRA